MIYCYVLVKTFHVNIFKLWITLKIGYWEHNRKLTSLCAFCFAFNFVFKMYPFTLTHIDLVHFSHPIATILCICFYLFACLIFEFLIFDITSKSAMNVLCTFLCAQFPCPIWEVLGGNNNTTDHSGVGMGV